MNLCSHGHEEIVHEGRGCPACEMVAEIVDLKDEVVGLKDELREARNEIIQLQRNADA